MIAGDRAEQAGLKAGDVVLAVNGERVVTRAQLIEADRRATASKHDRVSRSCEAASRVELHGDARNSAATRGMVGIYIVGADEVVQARTARSHSH